MSKRKQRSTAIRKRIEKKQREQQKANKKALKAAGGGDSDALVAFTLPRERVEACRSELAALVERLAQGSLRGWTTSDLEGDHGLAWFGRAMGESLADSDADPVTVVIPEQAKQPLLDRMGSLELAASGLKLEWDEAGFNDLLRALSQAEEPEESDDDDASESSSDETSDDDASSSDETSSSDDTDATTDRAG